MSDVRSVSWQELSKPKAPGDKPTDSGCDHCGGAGLIRTHDWEGTPITDLPCPVCQPGYL
jgi:hypothetical protein